MCPSEFGAVVFQTTTPRILECIVNSTHPPTPNVTLNCTSSKLVEILSFLGFQCKGCRTKQISAGQSLRVGGGADTLDSYSISPLRLFCYILSFFKQLMESLLCVWVTGRRTLLIKKENLYQVLRRILVCLLFVLVYICIFPVIIIQPQKLFKRTSPGHRMKTKLILVVENSLCWLFSNPV